MFIEVSKGELPTTPFGRTSEPASIDDSQLVARIIAAYKTSLSTTDQPSESFWDGAFAEQKRDVHEALI